MWRFKPFAQKEPTGLEGRYIDVGNLKVHVRNPIAEGGFSCVYLARDAVNISKQYALKHMICNDEESLELATKEINVMKSLKGHPNVVMLLAHTIFDMGRTKEVIVVMEYCEKSLVSVLESRGAGYFEEKQVLSIFRDVCNAVFAMHSQSPPIAHRDLKAENLLLGNDGSWKLCDFGSTSTNHKRFDRPEEMGIEEDNIRKYTTPAYRAPEMWDLFRRDVISEKVDIWALGCLLFRICYFKNAFDGESKLQVLNGNYRIPELPKYNTQVTDLIQDMLQSSPDDRPDITQVWFRVNEQLPVNLQKSLPDGPPEAPASHLNEGISKPPNRSPPMPNRSPPPPPSSSTVVGGAFWSSQYAKESIFAEDKSGPKFDEEPNYSTLRQERTLPENHTLPKKTSHVKDENIQQSHRNNTPAMDFEITFKNREVERSKAGGTSLFKDEAFNSFVAEFDTDKLNINKASKEEALEAEIERLKDELKQTNSEKAEITSKFEKLSAICRSQRQEIQEFKQALAARTPSPNKYHASTISQSSGSPQQEHSSWNTPSSEVKTWQAFPDDSKAEQQLLPKSSSSSAQSVRTKNSNTQQKTQAAYSWGFESESFTAFPTTSSQIIRPTGEGIKTKHGTKITGSSQPGTQPAGWAGF